MKEIYGSIAVSFSFSVFLIYYLFGEQFFIKIQA